MYSSIRINGYRGLDSFRMERLGRVNLLVGTNNSGKTSILECIELLRSAGNPHVLSSIIGRRGEWGYANEGDARVTLGPATESLDVSHLFANHELRGTIRIEADHKGVAGAGWNDKVTIHVKDVSRSDLDELNPDYDEWGAEVEHDEPRLVLHVKWANAEENYRAFVSDRGFLLWLRRPMRPRPGSTQAVQIVRTSGMSASDVARMFDQVVLTENEEGVTQALRILDPDIERIATVTGDRRRVSSDAPGGVFLKLAGAADRVPIGSMGDGMWRMLGLALSLANARRGVLLVDEIDTGLHYTVMEDMWRMISEQAAALSVQVFATTHSRDCYESLGAAVESDVGDVTIQRIDRSREKAVSITNQAIVAAAERNVEVR